VRFDKGPSFSSIWEQFLADIKVPITPSSAANPQSNGLAESHVKAAKLLLRKALSTRQNYQEMICSYNSCPRQDGYSPSEIFLGRRIRNALPTLNHDVDIQEAKAAREKSDLIAKEKHQVSRPQPELAVGDLCYRYKMDGKHEALIESPCEVLAVRPNHQSYYIRDIATDRVYLRNRKMIRPSESAKNNDHIAKSMETVTDTKVQLKLDSCNQDETAWNVSTTSRSPSASCLRKGVRDPSKRVHFDGSLFACRAMLRRFRAADSEQH